MYEIKEPIEVDRTPSVASSGTIQTPVKSYHFSEEQLSSATRMDNYHYNKGLMDAEQALIELISASESLMVSSAWFILEFSKKLKAKQK